MIDKTPSSLEYCLILLSSALEFANNKKITMNNLIIDAANEKIFLMLIKNKNIYSVSHENSKTNYEKLTILIDDFIKDNDLTIDKISKLYVNRGPGSFAGIRNSLAIVKAIFVAKKIDYYCYSFKDFGDFVSSDFCLVGRAKLADKIDIFSPEYPLVSEVNESSLSPIICTFCLCF